jgi:hypothetical protein
MYGLGDESGNAVRQRHLPLVRQAGAKDSLATQDGQVVGFCSPAHRDQFKKAVEHFPMMGTPGMSGMSATMPMMEHAENTLAVPPLVEDRVLLWFCRAVQGYADGSDLHDEAAAKLSDLKAALTNLRNLAILCRLAILGHPHSFARVIDEMHCIAVDFPSGPLDDHEGDGEFCEDEPDNRTQLAAAIDLFAGAAFVCKDDPCRRDRFIIGLIRAIEDVMAFPVTYSAEAAAYVGEGTGELSPAHASIVIGNATRRLIESDQKCAPRVPAEVRLRLRRLARQWMWANPVTAFLAAVSGPKVHRIVHWEDPARDQPDDARVGDPVTLLLACSTEDKREGDAPDDTCGASLQGLGVMFCPHQPAAVVRIVENGLEVRVPERACTGPIAVVQKTPDFAPVRTILGQYVQQYLSELSASVFGYVRMDVWCYPFAFGHPILEIMQAPIDATVAAFTPAGRLTNDKSVAVGDTVAIHYSVNPSGSDTGVPMSVTAPGGVVTPGARPGVLLYRPTAPGNTPVDLAWGNLKVSVPVSVKVAAPGRGTS